MGNTEDNRPADGGGAVVGISIRGGHAYFAVVRCPHTVLLDDPLNRIKPTEHVERPEGLGDFRDRVKQELRRIKPKAVGVGFTRRYKGWTANQAFRRFSLDAAAMLAAVDLDIPCQQVKEEDAARAVGVMATKMAEQADAKLRIERTDHWEDRVWAIATAVYIAKEQC